MPSVGNNTAQIDTESTSASSTAIKRVPVVEATVETTSKLLSVKSTLSDSLEEETWDRKPKTDYTYARTASYMKRSPSKGYPDPNMSRRRLHSDALYETSTHHSASGDYDDQTFFSSTRMSVQLQQEDEFGALSPIVNETRHHTEVTNANNANNERLSSTQHRRSMDPGESHSGYRRYPDSTTRSGTFYGVKERLLRNQNKRISQNTTRTLEFDETDVNPGRPRSHKYYEKQMEYAGESIPYKEAQTPLHSLYGLDRADIVHDAVDNTSIQSDKSVTSIVTMTSRFIRSGIVSSASGVYRGVTAVTGWVYTILSYLLVLAVASWRSHRDIQQHQQISETSTESHTETTLQKRRKSAYRSHTSEEEHREETAAIQGTYHTASHTASYTTSQEKEEMLQSRTVKKLAKILLFVPSLLYAYILYPCFLLLRAVVDSVRHGSSGLLASLQYCCVSIKETTLHSLTYVTTLWSSKSQTNSQCDPTGLASGLRKSPQLQKSVTFDVQEDVLESSSETRSGLTLWSRFTEFLYWALMFLPNTLYAYVLSPVFSGCRMLSGTVWNSLQFVSHTVVSGFGSVNRGVGSIFTGIYDRVSSFSLWRHEDTYNRSTEVTSHTVKHTSRRRQSERLSKRVEFSDTEDLTDSEEVAGPVSGSYREKQQNWCMEWLWTVFMFLPNRMADLFHGVYNLSTTVYNGCKSFVHWVFIEKIGMSLGSLGSSITNWSRSGTTTATVPPTSASSVAMETSATKVVTTHRSGTVTRRGASYGAVVKDTMYMATDEMLPHGIATGWCDKCLTVLLFVPKLLHGILLGMWNLVKYVWGACQAFIYWLFIDQIGTSANSGRSWITQKMQTMSSYLIITDIWILSRSRRRCGFCCLLPLLLLLPFLLCGSYYVHDQGRDAVVGGFPIGSILAGSTVSESTQSTTSSSSGWWPWFLLAGWFRSSDKPTVIVSEPKISDPVTDTGGGGWQATVDHTVGEKSSTEAGRGQSAGAGGLYLSEAELQAKIREVFIAMYGERETGQQVKAEQATQQILLQQTQVFNQYKLDVETMTKQIVKEELAAFAVGVNSQRSEDLGRHTELVKLQGDEADKVRQLQEQYTTLVTQSDRLIVDIQAARDKMVVQDEQGRAATRAMVSDLEGQLAALQADIAALQGAQANLLAQLRTCCKNDSTLALLVRAGVREQLSGFMAGAMGGGVEDSDSTGFLGAAGSLDNDSADQPSQSGSAFTLWLQNQFAKRDDLDSKMSLLAARLNDQIKSESEVAALAAVAAAAAAAGGSEKMAGSSASSNTVVVMGNGTGLTEEQVKLLIREALYVFGADKTGMVDYALESAGGSVINTRCSETYHRRTAQLSLFGIPLYYTSNSPRTVIQPEVHPGQCWAFRGSHGYLVIQLAGVVKPTAFSLEHIPKSLSPTGKIDSAPRDFTVRGLREERDKEGVDLGDFVYDDQGEPLQYFDVKDPDAEAFPIVELIINSNWGNEEYTCLYRFRVHGQLHKWMPES